MSDEPTIHPAGIRAHTKGGRHGSDQACLAGRTAGCLSEGHATRDVGGAGPTVPAETGVASRWCGQIAIFIWDNKSGRLRRAYISHLSVHQMLSLPAMAASLSPGIASLLVACETSGVTRVRKSASRYGGERRSASACTAGQAEQGTRGT